MCPYLWGQLSHHLTNVAWAEAYTSVPSRILIHAARLAITDMGRKLGTVPLGEAVSPSNTM